MMGNIQFLTEFNWVESETNVKIIVDVFKETDNKHETTLSDIFVVFVRETQRVTESNFRIVSRFDKKIADLRTMKSFN